ncbi:protein Red-like [Cavia porcellus]|uniref:protein Red-like n=1 Tax=Cavia porcellus TaxID=10141 RepID=UPI002FE2A474
MSKQDVSCFPGLWPRVVTMCMMNLPPATNRSLSRKSSGNFLRPQGLQLPLHSPTPSVSYHSMTGEFHEDGEPIIKKRKKKIYLADLHPRETGKKREVARKYRDRAKERRDGTNQGYAGREASATAPCETVGLMGEADCPAKNRRQLPGESRFLDSDIEHTRLVKGLDFALLQKVRTEIASEEKKREFMERVQKEIKDKDPENKIEFKTSLGRSIYQILFKNKVHKQNDLFLQGRMTYVINLKQDADSDIPITLIQGKHNCSATKVRKTTLTVKDTIISELIQVFSDARQRTDGKTSQNDKETLEEKKPPEASVSIFKDTGDYVQHMTKMLPNKEVERCQKQEHGRKRDGDHNRRWERDQDTKRGDTKKHSYFAKTQRDNEPIDKESGSTKGFSKSISEKFVPSAGWEDMKLLKKPEVKTQLGDFFDTSNSYAECYPATMDNMAVDSDEEVEYNRSFLSHWHFNTQEEYKKYRNNKISSKAAFQCDSKTSEGQKTKHCKKTTAEFCDQRKKSVILEKIMKT